MQISSIIITVKGIRFNPTIVVSTKFYLNINIKALKASVIFYYYGPVERPIVYCISCMHNSKPMVSVPLVLMLFLKYHLMNE